MKKLYALMRIFQGVANLSFNLYDYFHFLAQIKDYQELITGLVVAVPLIVLKTRVFLIHHFNLKIGIGIPQEHCKLILRTLFWFTVVVSVVNLASKCVGSNSLPEIIAHIAIYVVALILEYAEIEAVIEELTRS